MMEPGGFRVWKAPKASPVFIPGELTPGRAIHPGSRAGCLGDGTIPTLARLDLKYQEANEQKGEQNRMEITTNQNGQGERPANSFPGSTGEGNAPAARGEYTPDALATAREIQNRLQGEQIRVQVHFAEAVKHDSEKKQRQMEKEMEQEAAAAAADAAESVREKYREKNSAPWNEGKNDKAFRSLLAGIRRPGRGG